MVSLFRQATGIFYDHLAATGAGLVPVDKLKKAGLDTVIVTPLDPHASLEYRDKLFGQQVRTMMFTGPHWYAAQYPSTWRNEWGQPLPDPLMYRRQVSSDTLRILRSGDGVILDFEKIPVAWQQEFLIGRPDSTIWGWRARLGDWSLAGTNTLRETAFSNMPHQDNPVELYRKANAAYLAQLYNGNMDDVSAWDEAQWEQAQGVKPGTAFPIYDAADYQPEELHAGTYLFNQDRLKALWA